MTFFKDRVKEDKKMGNRRKNTRVNERRIERTQEQTKDRKTELFKEGINRMRKTDRKSNLGSFSCLQSKFNYFKLEN